MLVYEVLIIVCIGPGTNLLCVVISPSNISPSCHVNRYESAYAPSVACANPLLAPSTSLEHIYIIFVLHAHQEHILIFCRQA